MSTKGEAQIKFTIRLLSMPTFMFRDQILEIQHRNTKKYGWPKKVAGHLFGMAIVNSLAIKRWLNKNNPIAVLDFKRELMDSLCKIGNSNKVFFQIFQTPFNAKEISNYRKSK